MRCAAEAEGTTAVGAVRKCARARPAPLAESPPPPLSLALVDAYASRARRSRQAAAEELVCLDCSETLGDPLP